MPEDFGTPATAVLERDGLRVHTFTAPATVLANSTHVLETPSALVVVDGQFIAPHAAAFRRYVDALGKPIARMYLSHAHVDHWFGIAAAFADVDVWAAEATIAALRRDGEAERAARAAQYGPLVPSQVVVPRHVAEPGVDTVDGVKHEIEVVTGAECDAQLLITLPDHGVTVAQDLVYSGTHVYLTRRMDRSLALLESLAGSASDVFLAGHGPVADRAELRRNADYLGYARDRLTGVSDPHAYRDALVAAFPDRACPQLLDICVPSLFADSAAPGTGHTEHGHIEHGHTEHGE
ncbi:MBL fold metallo-hydrolase [Mangrovihabitans endophyticus]|uniref:MBL fold metallo-hydrolase n=1 Tax=Mangrovihabitans endophyticus TaxID=1751298 RepID=A0A8J3C028_9ACTN|nr:MBL fold metallo-hydrolase [Mangrovihabitans endophyticus]GGK99704.1 MBL fold metallo-hydrolase [Mangrovihabitans endophyticus]